MRSTVTGSAGFTGLMLVRPLPGRPRHSGFRPAGSPAIARIGDITQITMRLIFPSLHGYRPGWFRSDLLAGLTVWAVLVPESLAYGAIAGVSPVVGLYAAPGALVLYAALGPSRRLITGPMAATAALSAAAVGQLANQGDQFLALTTGLAIVTGVAALAAGLLRLGFLANFISEPVLKGFIIGLSMTIIVGQVPKLFGIEGGQGDFFERLWHLFGNLGELDGATLAVGLGSLAVLLALRTAAPRAPAALIAVILGGAVASAFGLASHGVATVGQVAGGLPEIGPPDLDPAGYGNLVAAGLGVMLVAFAEGLGAAKTFAGDDGEEVDPNRELVGLGGANLAAGFSGGMVVGGSLSKTAVSTAAGSRTQMTGLVAALLAVVTLLFLTGLFETLPEATLGAIVIVAVVDLVDFPSLVELYRIYTTRLGSIYGVAARPDFIAAIAALLGVLVFDTLPGLFIGIGAALLLLIYRSSRPNVAELGRGESSGVFLDRSRHPDAKEVPGVTVLRVEAGLFFANAEAVRTRILSALKPGVSAVVIDAETMPFIDVTAARVLHHLADQLTDRGVKLAVAREVGQVRDLVEATGEMRGIRVYPRVSDAVEAVSRTSKTVSPRRSADQAGAGNPDP